MLVFPGAAPTTTARHDTSGSMSVSAANRAHIANHTPGLGCDGVACTSVEPTMPATLPTSRRPSGSTRSMARLAGGTSNTSGT